jgi:hypothetical protein
MTLKYFMGLTFAGVFFKQKNFQSGEFDAHPKLWIKARLIA